MFGPDRVARGKRVGYRITLASMTIMVLAAVSGCSTPWGGRTQVMFYAPPGATVDLKSGSEHQIAAPGPYSERLEVAPEAQAVFDLSPGHYEFKYTSADGLPGVSVYGELEVFRPTSEAAAMYQRRALIPIQVPSAYYGKFEAIGSEMYPYRGEAYRAVIDELDLARLRQGDVVEKVIFVADLKEVEEQLDEVEQDIVALEREMEYADLRFRMAYQDFRMSTGQLDLDFSLLPKDRRFIKWEKKRKQLEQEMEDLIALQKRLKALLKGDQVLARRGMLVLATEEVVESHRDVVDAAGDLGEVMVVMRVGGRHMHWGDPATEVASYEK